MADLAVASRAARALPRSGGEFEALLTELDPELYEQAGKEHGRSKPRVGAHFAAHHSNPPTPVTDLYRRIREHLDPEVGRH
ncbi:hypothetical protein [Streptomyces tuirus]|uniref:hypothetical protein n=1 Tax=Streptomyces tuirus TaxID=68278 RepID=UPI001E2EDB4A|nr:hypothetical protein [Streptomyces tuirus]